MKTALKHTQDRITAEKQTMPDFAGLLRRVEALESLVACPRCGGTGSAWVQGQRDECPECHGDKINPVLRRP